MLRLLSKYLAAGNYEVTSASNAEDALGILHREGPPIVLSDWTMPGMDGIDLCRAIRASEAIGFVYIIIVTAQSDKQCVVEALDAGANDFLPKPFHHQELLARVNAGMRVIGLAGWSGAGKTTLIRRLIPELKRRGKTVVAITHDDRDFGCADRIVKLEVGRVVEAFGHEVPQEAELETL